MSENCLLSTSDILRILNIPRHKLTYMFDSKKLRKNDFTVLGNGQLAWIPMLVF